MKKILAVDDEKGIIEILRDILEQEGYEVLVAMDGVQAMMQVVKNKPDLVLLDIMLPAGGGFAVFDRMKQSVNTQNIPIIILTATPISKVREKLPLEDQTPILPKPWNTKELLSLIRNLSGRPGPAGTNP